MTSAPRVFIVEDEVMLGFLLHELLTYAGYEVVHVAHSLAEGLNAAATVEADVAILDINLGGHLSYAVADALWARRMPLVFATGYEAESIIAKYAHCPVVGKPYAEEHLVAALAQALAEPLSA